MAKKSKLGLSVKKSDDVHEWFTEVINKAELIEYTAVSGCYIFRPWSYAIWEKVQEFFDAKIKKSGVTNAYFPLFIPESLLKKEAKHVEGFAPEVAWVTHHGETKMAERLAIRPTSETIMYEAYAKWIRSHRDLPLRINQWCNVVRWEFKNPQPFLRSREFLWQEGHTAFATKEEADKEVHEMLDNYEQIYAELYAIPTLKGIKSEKEKFAGADYTTSVEAFLPLGKAIQGATSHQLGQNFAKAFDITFLDEKEQKQYVWQNSWGITTRTIGIMILMHGDDKGLVLPPRVAPKQVVIVPILFEDSKALVLKAARDTKKQLEKTLRVELDDGDEQSPGFKFNKWELKGVPIRVEIGPKDIEKNQVTVVRRDTGEKQSLPITSLDKEISLILDQIHENLYAKAKKFLEESTVVVKDLKEFSKVVKDKIAFAQWCGGEKCEEALKEKTGAKSLNSPFDQQKVSEKCFACECDAKKWTYFAKSL